MTIKENQDLFKHLFQTEILVNYIGTNIFKIF